MQTNNKLREALENSNGLLEELAAIGEWGESAREQIAENNAALSAPPRNCDVGTPDEQLPRFVAAWESAHRNFVDRRSMMMLSVFSRWAQMPYKAERKGEVEARGAGALKGNARRAQ